MSIKRWFSQLVTRFRQRDEFEFVTYEYTKKDGTVIALSLQEKGSIPTWDEQIPKFESCSLIQAGELQLKVCLDRGDYIALVYTETENFIDSMLYGEYKKETSTYHFYFAKLGEVELSEIDGQALYNELQSRPRTPPRFVTFKPEPDLIPPNF